MRRFLAGKVSIVEDGRMDGYYEEVEKYRNKRNYVPLVPASVGIGYGLFKNGSGMIAVTAAGVAVYSALHALILSRH
jgi:hypothetical protein